MSKSKVFKREELYQEVWARPIREVARTYGVSDVALGKICRKLGVPVPGRGYWAKKAAGQKLRRVKLPPLRSHQYETYYVDPERQPASRDGLGVNAQQLIARERDPAWRVQVGEPPAQLHPLIRMSRRVIRTVANHYPDEDPRLEHSIDIRVSHATLERAITVADALIRALEVRGFTVEVTKPAHNLQPTYGLYTHHGRELSQTRVQILGEWIKFGIEEAHVLVEVPEHALRKKRTGRLYPFRGKDCERQATGRLVLHNRSEGYGSRRRRSWGDGEKARIENRLNDFIIGLIISAEAKRVKHEEEQRRQQAELEAAQAREEQERRRAAHARLVFDLESRIDDWNLARSIREFLAEVEAAAVNRQALEDPESEVGRWVGWAKRYADRLSNNAIESIIERRSLPA